MHAAYRAKIVCSTPVKGFTCGWFFPELTRMSPAKKNQGPARWLPLGLVIGSYRKWETLFSKNLSVYWKAVSKKLFLYRMLLAKTKTTWFDSWPKCIHHWSHFYDRCCILRNTLGNFGHILMTAVVFSKRLEGNLATFLWQMLDLAKYLRKIGHIFVTDVGFWKILKANLVTPLWQILDLAKDFRKIRSHFYDRCCIEQNTLGKLVTFLWQMLDFAKYWRKTWSHSYDRCCI